MVWRQAQVVLGHRQADVTQIYAEADYEKGVADNVTNRVDLNSPYRDEIWMIQNAKLLNQL